MLSFLQFITEGPTSLARHYLMSIPPLADQNADFMGTGEATHRELGAIPTFFRNITHQYLPYALPGGRHPMAAHQHPIPYTVSKRSVPPDVTPGSTIPNWSSSTLQDAPADRLNAGTIHYYSNLQNNPGIETLVRSHEMRHGTTTMSGYLRNTIDLLQQHDPKFQELVGAYRIDPSEKNRQDAINHAISYHNGSWQNNPDHPLHSHFTDVGSRIFAQLNNQQKPPVDLQSYGRGIVMPKDGFIAPDPTHPPHIIRFVNNVVTPLVLHHTGGNRSLYVNGTNQEHPGIGNILGTVSYNPTADYNLSQSESSTTHSDLVSRVADYLKGFKTISAESPQRAAEILRQGHNEMTGEHLYRFNQTGDIKHLHMLAQGLRHGFIDNAAHYSEEAEHGFGRSPDLVDTHIVEPLRRIVHSTLDMSPEQKQKLNDNLDQFMSDHTEHHFERVAHAKAAGHLLATHHFGFEPAALQTLATIGVLSTSSQTHQDALQTAISGYQSAQKNLLEPEG